MAMGSFVPICVTTFRRGTKWRFPHLVPWGRRLLEAQPHSLHNRGELTADPGLRNTLQPLLSFRRLEMSVLGSSMWN